MPLTITPVDGINDPINGPADGDGVDAASISQGLQPLANQAKGIKNRIVAGVAASRYYLSLTSGMDVSAAWGMIAGSTAFVRRQSDTTGARELRWNVGLPIAKGTIKKLVANFHGGSGHVGLPATMPRIRLTFGWDYPGGSIGVNHDQSDTSASVVLYEAAHDVVLDLGAGLAYAGAGSLYVHVFGEAGANALNDKLMLGSLYLEIDP